MMLTAATLRLCMELAERIGRITEAHLYDNNFLAVEGIGIENKKFSITISVKEDEKDGN